MAEKEPLRVWSSKARKYRLVGRQHSGFSEDGMERVEFQTGDVVKLEPNEYEAFKDKFDSVKEVVVQAEPEPESAPASTQQTQDPKLAGAQTAQKPLVK